MFDPTTLHYSRLLQGMNKVIQDRTEELIRSRTHVADLRIAIQEPRGAKDDAIAAVTAGYGKLDEQVVKKITEDYNSGLRQLSKQNQANS